MTTYLVVHDGQELARTTDYQGALQLARARLESHAEWDRVAIYEQGREEAGAAGGAWRRMVEPGLGRIILTKASG